MKKYLLPESGTFYKANLHCHTTLSDGKLTPAEVKKIYMDKGYSIVAYTDHDILIPHPELKEENFLPLNGIELEVNEKDDDTPYKFIKSSHMCMISLEEDNVTAPCWHRSKYRFGNAPKSEHLVKFDDTLPDYERYYTHESISDMMKTGREKGFFVTYNHPTWSLENYADYMGYNNMHAMEIVNGACVAGGFDEYNSHAYDDMLRGGKRIYCIAADDNHNGGVLGTRSYDSFHGFVMIKAEKLEYRLITKALEEGNFYASQAPEIHALWLEDGRIHIECSDADRIILTTGIRRVEIAYAEEGKSIDAADFAVEKDDGYVRITVIDAHGDHADTNAYFTDEIL